MQPKVSVIVPVYNEERYIEECLSSLFNQTLDPLEIIVVDDGSTDASCRIIERLQQKANKLLMFKQVHQGPASARNLGAKEAKGDILVFVDADMRFDKQYLEKLARPIVRGDAVATFTKEEYVANQENIWAQCWSINSYFPRNLHIDPAMPEESRNFRAIKKSVFSKTRGYADVGYGEDVTVLSQLKGVMAKAAPGAFCYHFNPSTLAEVFVSARWMGRGETMRKGVRTFLTYSFVNSIRVGLARSFRHKKPLFLIFKLIFDFGVTVGLLERFLGKKHIK